MTIDKTLLRKHFNRHAYQYDRYARIQKQMAEDLLNLVEERIMENEDLASSGIGSILEIGCGTGYLTEKLTERFPLARVAALDLSEAMIAQAKERLNDRQGQVDFIVGDAEELTFATNRTSRFDLIISNAAFQWFNEPSRTVRSYMRLLRMGGIFAFATFGPKTFSELHHSFREAERQLRLPSVPHGQSFPAENFWREVFEADFGGVGKCRLTWYEREQVLHYAGVREFLNQVKRIGAGNATEAKRNHLTAGKRLFRFMEQIYGEKYADAGGIRATYHVCFGVWQKGEAYLPAHDLQPYDIQR